MSAFLEVVTRTFVGRRPDLLLRCHRSLVQLGPGLKHSILVDHAPLGVPYANRKLSTFEATGDWVWVLDDDDVCSYKHLIQDLKWLAETVCPDAVIVRAMWLQRDGLVLPPDEMWGKRPVLGKIGTPCVITRGDVWNEYRVNWGERYAGDFDYIDGLFDAGLDIAWLDVVAAEVPQVNSGRAGG